jgi:GTP-binding protein
MADIPGIIEGAHEGKGLGTRFLRHIERNATLLFMIPATSVNIKDDFAVLKRELKLYNKELLNKSRLLAITQCDLVSKEEIKAIKKLLPRVPHVFISAATGMGIDELKDKLYDLIHNSADL